MELNTQQNELAGAYVKQELTNKVLSDFETELAHNAALQEEVIFQKSIVSALKLDRVEQAMHQAKIDNMVDDKKENPQFKVIQNNMQQARIDNANRRRIRRRWASGLATAASIVLISIFGLKMYLNNQLDSDMAEVATTVELRGISLTENTKEVSARPDVIRVKLKQAEQAFKEGNWEATLSIFGQLRNQYKYNSFEMNFCESIIFYNKKEYRRSVEKLESINLDEAESACDVQHFLTLSYLKIKNKPKAKEQYQMLTESPQKCNKQTIENLKIYFTL